MRNLAEFGFCCDASGLIELDPRVGLLRHGVVVLDHGLLVLGEGHGGTAGCRSDHCGTSMTGLIASRRTPRG